MGEAPRRLLRLRRAEPAAMSVAAEGRRVDSGSPVAVGGHMTARDEAQTALATGTVAVETQLPASRHLTEIEYSFFHLLIFSYKWYSFTLQNYTK